MWSLVWSGLSLSAGDVRLDASGHLYLSGGRLNVDGKSRMGVVCFSE